MHVENLFAKSSAPWSHEVPLGHEIVQQLASGGSFKLERIISLGQATPAGQWYDQDEDEWVVLLAGSAGLRLASQPGEIVLRPGDYLHIAAHERHRVEWTDPKEETIWLALYYRAS
jgi:cupin 2 domain-containing protein